MNMEGFNTREYLRKLYGLDSPQEKGQKTDLIQEEWDQLQKDIFDNKFTVLDGLDKRREFVERVVKDLPVEYPEYSAEEIKTFHEVRFRLKSMVNDFKVQYQDLDPNSDQYKAEARKLFSDMIDYLDGLSIWKFKFSTDEAGGNELGSSNDDSIYYITESGASIRVKRGVLAQGYNISDAVQPFADKIVFIKRGHNAPFGETVKDPAIGYIVHDYMSDNFSEAINGPQNNTNFISPVEVFMKDGEPFFINSGEGIFHHNGHAVNKIFELKKVL